MCDCIFDYKCPCKNCGKYKERKSSNYYIGIPDGDYKNIEDDHIDIFEDADMNKLDGYFIIGEYTSKNLYEDLKLIDEAIELIEGEDFIGKNI